MGDEREMDDVMTIKEEKKKKKACEGSLFCSSRLRGQ